MKTLAELRPEIAIGSDVCGTIDLGDGLVQTHYVFRSRVTGLFVRAYEHGDYNSYHAYGCTAVRVRLVREDEPEFDPEDYYSLLDDGWGSRPIWQPCRIPDELMARFLAEYDEEERRCKKHLSWYNTTVAKMDAEDLIDELTGGL